MIQKTFFVGNRQSGKTTKAVYEFMKNPEETILVCPNSQSRKELLQRLGSAEFEKNIIPNDPSETFFRGRKAKRMVYDEYLMMDYETRNYFHKMTIPIGVEEIFCFATPQELYDKNLFDFVVNMKKEKRNLFLDNQYDLCINELVLEMTDPTIRTPDYIEAEILELFHNYLTDPDTKIIHHQYLMNEKIGNLQNISYFPDEYKELTELKGAFIKEQLR